MRSPLPIAAVALGLLVMTGGGCDLSNSTPKSVLHWEDVESGTTYSITTRETLVDNITELELRRNDSVRRVLLDDKVGLSIVGLIRHGDWILVLNNQYVIGGYNVQEDLLCGASEYRRFPYTVWLCGGSVLAEASVNPKLRADRLRSAPLVVDPACVPTAVPTKTANN